jgi:hypothetical protein
VYILLLTNVILYKRALKLWLSELPNDILLATTHFLLFLVLRPFLIFSGFLLDNSPALCLTTHITHIFFSHKRNFPFSNFLLHSSSSSLPSSSSFYIPLTCGLKKDAEETYKSVSRMLLINAHLPTRNKPVKCEICKIIKKIQHKSREISVWYEEEWGGHFGSASKLNLNKFNYQRKREGEWESRPFVPCEGKRSTRLMKIDWLPFWQA